MSGQVIRILRLPATATGRQLLRDGLPFLRDGAFPDGSRLDAIDFDALAIEVEKEVAEYERWCAERDSDGGGRAA